MNGRAAIRRNSMTSGEPAITPPQEASDLENVAIRRSTWSSTPNSSQAPAPRAPSTPKPCASSTIRRAPYCLRQRDDLGQRRDVALHRVDAVDHDEDAAAVLLRGGQPLLEQVEAVVTEGAQLRLGEQAAVEDRGVVARVGDHRVLRAEDRAERARGWPGGRS